MLCHNHMLIIQCTMYCTAYKGLIVCISNCCKNDNYSDHIHDTIIAVEALQVIAIALYVL